MFSNDNYCLINCFNVLIDQILYLVMLVNYLIENFVMDVKLDRKSVMDVFEDRKME